jgi:hypothetical protein
MFDKFRDELNEISPSFCVAKWKQVTMHLQNGHTHSCHHPSTHFVSVEELKKNKTALHNSEFKKEQRKMMLEGTRPSECDYCWRVEDAGLISDRVYKSSDRTWARPYINEILSKSWNENIDPSYVEVSFGNVCNFKCSYCAPQFSSQWMEEVERHGGYPTSGLKWLEKYNSMPIPNKDENPYVDAFWEWFPDMYKNLQYFRITGGEPLLNKNTFRILDYIIANPNPNLEVAINSNMNPPKDLLDAFLEKINIILNQKKLKRIKIFTSCEAYGQQAEYIRHGMNYFQWLNNLRFALSTNPNLEFTVMSTYNLLSIPSYKYMLEDMIKLIKEFRSPTNKAILIDMPYLRFPEHQTIFIMEPEHLHYIEEQIKVIEEQVPDKVLSEIELERIKRIYTVAQSSQDEWQLNNNRKDFILFVNEHDKRRNTNFVQTFPEYKDLYEKWSKL